MKENFCFWCLVSILTFRSLKLHAIPRFFSGIITIRSTLGIIFVAIWGSFAVGDHLAVPGSFATLCNCITFLIPPPRLIEYNVALNFCEFYFFRVLGTISRSAWKLPTKKISRKNFLRKHLVHCRNYVQTSPFICNVKSCWRPFT